MSLMAGKCPECGVLVEASNPTELADLIVLHRCDPDLWLAQETAYAFRVGGRRSGKSPGVVIDKLERELERTQRALFAAWLVVAVEGLALVLSAVLWIVAR